MLKIWTTLLLIRETFYGREHSQDLQQSLVGKADNYKKRVKNIKD